MSGEVMYQGLTALGQGLSGGGIEGMLQRERQKAELENAIQWVEDEVTRARARALLRGRT